MKKILILSSLACLLSDAEGMDPNSAKGEALQKGNPVRAMVANDLDQSNQNAEDIASLNSESAQDPTGNDTDPVDSTAQTQQNSELDQDSAENIVNQGSTSVQTSIRITENDDKSEITTKVKQPIAAASTFINAETMNECDSG